MSIARVQYRERQRLSTADLRAEQAYRLGLARRHHLGHHQWGIVRGLRVLLTTTQGWVLTPGVAIDGYGREILVPEAVELTLTPAGCTHIVLYYCESPEQAPPDRPCEERPAPRIGQRFVVKLQDEFTPPVEPDDDFGALFAEGLPSPARPWPVLVARVGRGCVPIAPLVDYSHTRYVRHRASQVRTPTDRVLLQLGLTSQSDIYHFLLSTRGNPTGLKKRVAIDRDGEVHVWRPLVIAGDEAVGQFQISASQAMQVRTVMPAGIGRRLLVTGELDLPARTLSASVHELGEPGPILPVVQPASVKFDLRRPDRPINLALAGAAPAMFERLTPAAFAAPAAPAGLAIVGEPAGVAPPPPPPAAPAAPAAPPVVAFSVEATPTGGALILQPLDSTATPEVRECDPIERDRLDGADDGTPLVRFKPAAELAGSPLAREIFVVTTSRPEDTVPRTEMRVSGGAEDESDVSTRVSIGAWVKTVQPPPAPPAPLKEYASILRMGGGRRLDLVFPPGTANRDQVLLEAKRTVYLPPIGKKDPLLPDLMAMAFMNGLRLTGHTNTAPAIALTLVDPAPVALPARPTIVRGQTVKYSLTLTYTNAVTIKSCLELVNGRIGPGDVAFRMVPVADLPATATPKQFEIPDFRHRADSVRLAVHILSRVGTRTGVVVGTSELIDVVDA